MMMLMMMMVMVVMMMMIFRSNVWMFRRFANSSRTCCAAAPLAAAPLAAAPLAAAEAPRNRINKRLTLETGNSGQSCEKMATDTHTFFEGPDECRATADEIETRTAKRAGGQRCPSQAHANRRGRP